MAPACYIVLLWAALLRPCVCACPPVRAAVSWRATDTRSAEQGGWACGRLARVRKKTNTFNSFPSIITRQLLYCDHADSSQVRSSSYLFSADAGSRPDPLLLGPPRLATTGGVPSHPLHADFGAGAAPPLFSAPSRRCPMTAGLHKTRGMHGRYAARHATPRLGAGSFTAPPDAAPPHPPHPLIPLPYPPPQPPSCHRWAAVARAFHPSSATCPHAGAPP